VFALSLPVIIGLISIFLGVVRWVYGTFFSKNAKVDAIIAKAERGKARLKAERDRLRAANTRIDAEPPKTGQDLVDKLNQEFGEKK
jgi:hypothetical protein